MKHVRVSYAVHLYFDDDEDIGKMSPEDTKQAVETMVNDYTFEQLGRWLVDKGSFKVEVIK